VAAEWATALVVLILLVMALIDRPATVLQTLRLTALNETRPAGGDLARVFRTGVERVDSRWFGSPAVWQPPPLVNTEIRYFNVTGSTRGEIIRSLNAANLCKVYGPCAVDPANPTSGAWGLEWEVPAVSSYTCDTPATTTVPYREIVLLPRWSPHPLGGVTVDLVQAWNALEQVIYTHEATHATIAIDDINALNAQAHQLATCDALVAFWGNAHVWDKLQADQAAFHARLRADCRPELGCIPAGYMGW
jgi:predicted secreted Zn-dependent protease